MIRTLDAANTASSAAVSTLNYRRRLPSSTDMRIGCWLRSLLMADDGNFLDMAGLAVLPRGELRETGNPWMPFELVDVDGADFCRWLMIAGRPGTDGGCAPGAPHQVPAGGRRGRLNRQNDRKLAQHDQKPVSPAPWIIEVPAKTFE
jgi:hypothetical protein